MSQGYIRIIAGLRQTLLNNRNPTAHLQRIRDFVTDQDQPLIERQTLVAINNQLTREGRYGNQAPNLQVPFARFPANDNELPPLSRTPLRPKVVQPAGSPIANFANLDVSDANPPPRRNRGAPPRPQQPDAVQRALNQALNNPQPAPPPPMATNFNPTAADIFRRDTGTSTRNVKIARATHVNLINAALGAYAQRRLRKTAVAGGAAGPFNADVLKQDEWNAFLQDILTTLADAGSSDFTDWSEYKVRINASARIAADPAGVVIAARTVELEFEKIARAILTTPNGYGQFTTLRRYARYYANAVFEFGKRHRKVWLVGVSHGVPSSYAYVGFDFADAITLKLSKGERRAINFAKAAGLFRAAGESYTDSVTHIAPEQQRTEQRNQMQQ